jgi:hypothetical protein
MEKTNRFSLALEALVELAPEIAATQVKLLPTLPALEDILADLGNLPPEALFLGIADDGLPVLLNLHDAVPGPLLVSGDPGSGKTSFLQTVARALVSMHDPCEVQFGVVTAYPDEWQEYEPTAHCAGIFPYYEKSAMDFILSLSAWAHANKSRQAVILLLDDLARIEDAEPETKDNLRWLLLRGTSRRVWPIVTLNPTNTSKVLPWLDLFRTRIFGAINDVQAVEPITKSPNAGVASLVKGSQFTMREGAQWLRFWIPHVNEGESHEQRHALVR